MNTYATKPSDIERKWYVVDAQGVVLGRLSAQIAKILQGKNKPNYVSNLDCFRASPGMFMNMGRPAPEPTKTAL